MEKTKKKIVVTCDFTDVSKNALMHGILLAKKINADIDIVNIVKKEKEIENALENLKNFAKPFETNDIKFDYVVKEGSIYNEIKDYAFNINALFVVMGTHGIKGMQKLIGSKALKVIANSLVPFIVVQEKPNNDDYFSKIIVPIDDTVETKEKLKWVPYFKTFFNTKFYLLYQLSTNEYIERSTKANLIFAKKFIQSKEAEYEVVAIDENKSFSKALINYAEEISANGILIMTIKDPQITDYFFGTVAEEIIANDSKIPVICVSPRIDTKRWTSFY
ncbi:MAG: universal stress protein [Bacteroidales bacterium]|nr:universal stress protein [Bacteroidales bacterium]